MTTGNESRQVLDMLAEGKISADEAQRLLEKLQTARSSDGRSASETDRSSREERAQATHSTTTAVLVSPATNQKIRTKSRPRYLRILITDSGGEEVNIRIPLQFVRAGVKLVAILPNDARRKIQESGIDLSKLNELEGDALIEALCDLSIHVDSSGGETVRIFCE